MFNPPAIENVMFVNVVPTDVVINAVLVCGDPGLTTEMTLVGDVESMLMFCDEKVCSTLNENVASSLIEAADVGNRVV